MAVPWHCSIPADSVAVAIPRCKTTESTPPPDHVQADSPLGSSPGRADPHPRLGLRFSRLGASSMPCWVAHDLHPSPQTAPDELQVRVAAPLRGCSPCCCPFIATDHSSASSSIFLRGPRVSVLPPICSSSCSIHLDMSSVLAVINPI